MRTWDELMTAARADAGPAKAVGHLATPAQRIVAYNSQAGFMANMAMAYAIDEQR